MNQDPNNVPTIPPAKPRGRNTAVIIIVVLLVLCCILALVLVGLWQYGDQLLELFGITL